MGVGSADPFPSNRYRAPSGRMELSHHESNSAANLVVGGPHTHPGVPAPVQAPRSSTE
jgi:hypothetical protein